MRHKKDTIAFVQGWMGSQLEYYLEEAMKSGNEHSITMAQQTLEQWKIIDESLDDLLRLNKEYETKLSQINSVIGGNSA